MEAISELSASPIMVVPTPELSVCLVTANDAVSELFAYPIWTTAIPCESLDCPGSKRPSLISQLALSWPKGASLNS